MRKTDSFGLNLLDAADKISLEPINENTVCLEKAIQSTSHTNLLDNWYFGNPVNQRGQAEYTGAGYTIDRWAFTGGNTSALIEDGYIRFRKTAAGNNPAIMQASDNHDLVGRTVTASILYRGSFQPEMVQFVNGSVAVNIDPSDQWNVFHITYSVDLGTFGSFNNRVLFGVQLLTNMQTTDYFDIKAVKLELGSVQTLAHQNGDGDWVLNEISDYHENLFKCCMSTADPSDIYANNKILHTGNMFDLGMPRIETGSYVGTGVCDGGDNANTLTFGFAPKFVCISGARGATWFIQGCTSACVASDSTEVASIHYVRWSGNSVQWWSSYVNGEAYQLNESGATYYYIAIG